MGNIVGIAYAWGFAPLKRAGSEVIVALSVAEMALPDNETLTRGLTNRKLDNVTTHVLELRLGPASDPIAQSDVSGVIGLMHGRTGGKFDSRLSVFERTIADLLVLEMDPFVSNGAARDTVLLVQGPTLPKFRGRVFYRGFDPDAPRILSVTFQPEWVTSIIGERPPQETQASEDGRWKTKWGWEGPLPDIRADSGARCFIKWERGRPAYHVEVLANCCPKGLGKDWWDERIEDCKTFFENMAVPEGAVPESDPDLTRLPMPLAVATATARRECRQEKLLQLIKTGEYVQDEDMEELVKAIADSQPALAARGPHEMSLDALRNAAQAPRVKKILDKILAGGQKTVPLP